MNLKWVLCILGVLIILNGIYMLRKHKTRVGSEGVQMTLMLSFLFMAILPGFWAVGVANYMTASFEETDFCTAKCHSMEYYGQSLTVQDDEPLASVHYRNNYVDQSKACYVCHTSYSAFGTLEAKLRGAQHVWVNYFGKIPDTLKLYSEYKNSDCLQCHGPSERFQNNKKHLREEEFLARSRSGKLSCLECHDVAHYVPIEDDDEDDFGDEDFEEEEESTGENESDDSGSDSITANREEIE